VLYILSLLDLQGSSQLAVIAANATADIAAVKALCAAANVSGCLHTNQSGGPWGVSMNQGCCALGSGHTSAMAGMRKRCGYAERRGMLLAIRASKGCKLKLCH
jgi:hypothetical protein